MLTCPPWPKAAFLQLADMRASLSRLLKLYKPRPQLLDLAMPIVKDPMRAKKPEIPTSIAPEVQPPLSELP